MKKQQTIIEQYILSPEELGTLLRLITDKNETVGEDKSVARFLNISYEEFTELHRNHSVDFKIDIY